MGSTISKLFGGDKDEGKADAPKNETEPETTEKPQDSNEATETPPVNDTASESAPKNETATEKPKVVVIKEQISAKTEELVMKTLNDEQFEESLKRMDEIYKIEQEKLRRENAVNSLETHVIEAQRRFEEPEYISCATQKELEEIKAMCSEISDWIYEDGIDAKVEVFEEKLDTLTKKTNEVYARHWEHNERPEALKALKGMIEGAQGFLATARNITQDPEKKDVFNDKEIDDLAKGIQDVIDWRDKEVSAQNKMPKNEPVRLTVKHLTDKMAFLDREVKYLVNKIKRWRPKEKPKEKKAKNETTSSNTTEQDAEVPQTEPKVEENEIKDEEIAQTIDEPVPLDQNDENKQEQTEEAKIEPTETEDDKEEHTEL